VPPVWAVRPKSNSATGVSTQGERIKEDEQDMARRKLSLDAQLRGIRAALKSRRTPPQLKPGLERRKEWLEKSLGHKRKTR
jgi:hypothetical protein